MERSEKVMWWLAATVLLSMGLTVMIACVRLYVRVITGG
jgi:hypothetical protein